MSKLRPISLTLTIKVLLHCKFLNHRGDMHNLDYTASQYTKVCNYISKRYWVNGCKSFTRNVRHDLYYSIRSMFGLKAQEAGTVFRTVKVRYRTVETQM